MSSTAAGPGLPPDVIGLTIPTALPVGPVNLYLLVGDPLTLVDTGPDSASGLVELERLLADHGLRVEDLELIVLTHEHPDHAGLAGVIARRSGAPIAAHAGLGTQLADYARFCRERDAQTRLLMRRHGVTGLVADTSSAFMRALDRWGGDVAIDVALHDGATLTAGGRSWRVLHRPGHSDSDIVLHDEATGLMLAGDHLLGHVSSIAVMMRTALTAGGDRSRALPTLRASLRETEALSPSLVLAGHGAAVRDPAALIARRLRQQDERAAAILELLGPSEPAPGAWLAERLFDGLGPHETYMSVTEVLGHLDLLVDAGAVVEETASDVIRFRRA